MIIITKVDGQHPFNRCNLLKTWNGKETEPGSPVP